MTVLPISYWISTIVGIIAAATTDYVNLYILKKYTLKTWKKIEYQLISARVVFDVICGSSTTIFHFSSIFASLYFEMIPFEVSFLIALFSNTFAEMRILLAAIISIERTIATCAPISFFIYRKRLSNILIFVFVLFNGVFFNFVGFCGLQLPLESGCKSFNCALPQCSRYFLATSRIIMCLIIVCFSMILCFKLCWLSIKKRKEAKDLRRANLMSLADGLSTLIFDMMPSLMFQFGFVEIRNSGPVIGAIRPIGRVMEALMMVKLMKNATYVQPTQF